MTRKSRRNQPEVFRITGARQGLAEDVRGRQRRYVISMLIRTAAVLLAVGLWNASRPLALLALVVGTVLPYVAVVIANAGRENTPALPPTFAVPPPPRPQLGPVQGAGDQGRRPGGRPAAGTAEGGTARGDTPHGPGCTQDTDGTGGTPFRAPAGPEGITPDRS